MRNLISWLSRSAGLRRAVQLLRVHRIANWWLGLRPWTKRLAGSDIVVRATRIESIPLAQEMFDKGVLYDAHLLPKGFTTFADLGCNVGYFTCWLAHIAAGRKLKGVMLDANPHAVKEAQWHANANGMNEVFGIHGIAGEGNRGDSVEFFLYESNICSTSHLPDLERMALKGKWERIQVPAVSIEEHWKSHFSDARCHLLKVDIEGSELNFLKAETQFLARCDSLLVEWHKWKVSIGELTSFLETQHFRYIKTLDENDQMGTAFYVRA